MLVPIVQIAVSHLGRPDRRNCLAVGLTFPWRGQPPSKLKFREPLDAAALGELLRIIDDSAEGCRKRVYQYTLNILLMRPSAIEAYLPLEPTQTLAGRRTAYCIRQFIIGSTQATTVVLFFILKFYALLTGAHAGR